MDAQTTSEKLRQLRDTYTFAMSLDPATRGDMAEKTLELIRDLQLGRFE